MVNGLTLVSIFCLTKICFYIYFLPCVYPILGAPGTWGRCQLSVGAKGPPTTSHELLCYMYVFVCVVYVGARRRTLSLLKICPWSMQNAAPCAEKLKLWAQRLAFFAKYNTEKLGGSLNKMNSFERKNVLQ